MNHSKYPPGLLLVHADNMGITSGNRDKHLLSIEITVREEVSKRSVLQNNTFMSNFPFIR